MRTTVVTAPTGFLVEPSTVQLRLGMQLGGAPDIISAYVSAAVANLDGPTGIMGRALGLQTLQLQAAHFPGRCHHGHAYYEEWPVHRGRHEQILLSYPEIISVTAITYIDVTGASQTLDPSTYIVSGRRIVPSPGNCWPMTQYRPDAVTVIYRAGYAPANVPQNLVQAIVLMVATMISMGRSDISLKQETVFGVSSLQWDTTATASETYDRAISYLLAPLMVYSRDA